MIIFRTDGNAVIGSGHVMRCLAIAQACRRREECCFVVADGSFAPKIEEEGFPVTVLNTDCTVTEEELPFFIKIVKEKRPTHIVVDSYYVTGRYFDALRQCGAQVIYIDDLAQSVFSVDKLVNYNVYADKNTYLNLYNAIEEKAPQLYLGTQYAPLREEFANLIPPKQPRVCNDVLISTGGADPIHLAIGLVKQIKEDRRKNSWAYHIVVGSHNQDCESIEKLAQELPNVIIHKDVKQMAQLMRRCNIAVSAAGSTLYELCACGIPTITYCLADNQKKGMDAFSAKGLMQSLGDLRGVKDAPERVLDAVSRLAAQYDLRKTMASAMRTMVDGCGADRLADCLI